MNNLTEYQGWLFQSSADAKYKLKLSAIQRAYAEAEQARRTLLECLIEEMEKNSPTESLITTWDAGLGKAG